MINNLTTVEPSVTPANPITFLLDWELTMKCNLDCSYCDVGENGGHDNSTQHPPLNECLASLDFMFEYADIYMQTKRSKSKFVVLNIYGGESLHHPDIVKILSTIREKQAPYKDRWQVTVTTTTNAIVNERKMSNIIPLIDEFTVSYHSENTPKQKEEFKRNVLNIKAAGVRQKCIVLMNPHKFDDCTDMITWLTDNDIKFLPRQLDVPPDTPHLYTGQQVIWFNSLYSTKSFKSNVSIPVPDDQTNLSKEGRACCGGRQLCVNQDYSSRTFYVKNSFTDWYCSVNEYFLYVKQVNGKIYTNKDCKMNFNSEIGPIGNLNDTETLLSYTRSQIANNTLPVIQCKQSRCRCGLCAPKAESLDTYKQIMLKYKHEK